MHDEEISLYDYVIKMKILDDQIESIIKKKSYSIKKRRMVSKNSMRILNPE